MTDSSIRRGYGRWVRNEVLEDYSLRYAPKSFRRWTPYVVATTALGGIAYLADSWVTQAARNLVMDLQDADCRARYLIRDRDGKFPGLFDAVLADAGIQVVLTGVRMPRMNPLMDRWVQTCRRELA